MSRQAVYRKKFTEEEISDLQSRITSWSDDLCYIHQKMCDVFGPGFPLTYSFLSLKRKIHRFNEEIGLRN